MNTQTSSLADGDCFGEMTIVDETDPSETALFVDVKTSLRATKRQLSVKTAEESYILRIDNNIMRDILQPPSITRKSMFSKQTTPI